ncbi:MAG: SEL1-like repeat protein [Rhizobiales bacterium]|nr:SEL1-like repeat protein [Hyphomicrobiales bacterium]
MPKPLSPAKEIYEPPKASPSVRRDDTTTRLEEIAQQLARLARGEDDGAAAPVRHLAEPFRPDTEKLERIVSRIDGNERQTVEAFTAVNDRLSVLGGQIAQAARAKPIERPEDVPGFPALETAIRNVVDHIELSERRHRETLRSLQERLAEMSERAAGADSDQLVRSAPAFASLEQRISDLARRVERSEAQAQDGLLELLRDEIGQLADRIEEVRAASEGLAARAQSTAVSTTQGEIRDIEKRILELLRETQTALSNQAVSGEDLQRIRHEVGTLNRRIDEQRAGFASSRDLETLRVAVEQLSTRVAQGPDMRPLADLDRRLGEVAGRLEQTVAASRNPSHFADLEARIADLDRRLAEAISHQDDGAALASVEQHLAEVSDRIAKAEQQLGRFDTVERAIAQLFEGLEQSRGIAREAAEEAANRVADRLAAALPKGDAGPLPELKALEDGLRVVRESAVASDQRNQETLEAVHETLEQIVGKLAELETAATGHQLAINMAQQAAAEALPAEPRQSATPKPAVASIKLPVESVFDEPATFRDNLPQMMPLAEPARAEPAAAPKPSLGATVLRSAAVDSPPGSDELADGDDFIAAARRAAQAASSRPNTLSADVKPAIKSGANSRFKFTLPFIRRKPQAKPMVFSGGKPVSDAKPAAPSNSRRQRLLLAVVAALVVVSAGTFVWKKTHKPAKQSSAIEAPLQSGSVAAQSATETAPADKTIAMVSEPVGDGSTVASRQTGSLSDLVDTLTTAALPAHKSDAILNSIVAQPGSSVEAVEPPPAEIGSQSLRDAAAKGDATAQFIVASRYLDGQVLTQDFTKAAYWYQQAATRGLAPAQYRLATLFERGKGAPRDMATALLWYERAASAGNVKAMHNAAVIAAGSEAGTPNYDKAFRWFGEAAKRGLKDSQFNLAVLYERGLGARIDTGEALFWYGLAAKQGDTDAEKRAAELAKALPAATAADIEKRIAQWKPQPAVDDANMVAVTDQDWKPVGNVAATGN